MYIIFHDTSPVHVLNVPPIAGKLWNPLICLVGVSRLCRMNKLEIPCICLVSLYPSYLGDNFRDIVSIRVLKVPQLLVTFAFLVFL